MRAQRLTISVLIVVATVCFATVVWFGVDAARARDCLDGRAFEQGWRGSAITDQGCVARYFDRVEVVALSGPSLGTAVGSAAVGLLALMTAAVVGLRSSAAKED